MRHAPCWASHHKVVNDFLNTSVPAAKSGLKLLSHLAWLVGVGRKRNLLKMRANHLFPKRNQRHAIY